MSDRWIKTVVIVALCGPWGRQALCGDEPITFEGYSPTAKLTVDRYLKALSKLKTYSDEAVIKMETGMAFSQEDQPVSFTYAKPRRFRMETSQHEIVSDGKEMSVLMKAMRRYTVSPLKEDLGKQTQRYFGAMGMSFGVGEMILSNDPRKKFAEDMLGLDVTGNERIDGDRCVILSGSMSGSSIPMFDDDVPVDIHIRESDMMIRRITLDLSDAMKKRFEDAGNAGFSLSEYRVIYDVLELKVNKPLDEATFKFTPPTSAKKVDKFYSAWNMTEETAAQFELSGKPAPEFELETTEGEWVSLDDLQGKVAVLSFLPRWQFGQATGLDVLDAIRSDYAEKGVEVICFHPGANADKLTEKLDQQELELTIALDPGGDTQRLYSDDQMGAGIILVGKDGTVQGRYAAFLGKDAAEWIRNDIDKLLAGKKLPGGEVMTDEQIDEALEQRGARFSFGGTAEPLNEERLRETWSVRAVSGGQMNFSFGGSSGGRSRDLWIRDKDAVKRVNADGEITAEIPLPTSSLDQFSQERYVAGKIGSRLGLVHMKTIPGDEEQMGYRPPKEVIITAVDEEGDEVWHLEFEVKQYQLPAHLTLGDIDGRPGDEFLFVHQSALWVVDGRGEVVVRKPIVGIGQWMVVEDRDRDRRAEIYLRTQSKLIRFDYEP